MGFETHQAKLGSLELSVKDKEPVNIPVWARELERWQAAAIVGGYEERGRGRARARSGRRPRAPREKV